MGKGFWWGVAAGVALSWGYHAFVKPLPTTKPQG